MNRKLLAFLCVAFLALPATTASVEVADGLLERPPVEARVISSDAGSTVLEVELGTAYREVADQVGVGLVAVPPTSGVTARITSLSVRRQGAEGRWTEPERVAPDGWAELAGVSEPGIWRDLRVVSVTVTPRPASDVLVERATVELVYEGTGPNPLTHGGRPVSPEFHRMYQGLVLNYEWLGMVPWTRSDAIRYLIITADHLEEAGDSLAAWRDRTGMRAHVVTRSEIGGGSQASGAEIEAYIQDAYDNWSQPPEFVVLLGDRGSPCTPDEEMPTCSTPHGSSDHGYVLLDGSDFYADAFIGRMPTRWLSTCQHVVNKIIQYESNPLIDPGVTWQEKALMCGGYYWYPSVTAAKRWVADTLLAYGYAAVDSVYDPDMPGIDPDLMIATAINEGRGIVNYRGDYTLSDGWHPLGFLNEDVQNYVHNGWRLPLVLSVSCGTGTYYGGTHFGEYFFRYSDAGGPKGCIAFFGATSLSTHTLQNNWMDKGIFVGFFTQQISRVTEATEYGKMWLLAQQGYHIDTERTFYWFYVMGDPGTQIWLDRPEALQVTHPASIPVGPQALTVTVRDHQGAVLTGALVCAWKGTEVYQYGYTTTGGSVNLAIDPVTTGPMLLTVTARNMLPYQGTVLVTGGDVIPPAAVDDLVIGPTVQGDITLAWSEVTQDTTGAAETLDHYEVYRDTEAYLDPADGLTPLGTVPAGTTSYTDLTSGVGQPELNHYYCVIAVDQADNRSAVSNRVGEFDRDTGQ
jgi:hypothetical protein